MDQLPIILGGLILAGVLWIAKTVTDYGKDLAVIRTTLTGVNGDNGLVGDVKALRAKAHDHGDEIHSLKGRADITELRLNTIDQQLSA